MRPLPPPRRIASYAIRRAKRAVLSPVRGALRRYAQAAPDPRDTVDADRRVFILLVSAWGMGGTIRSAHNVASHLAKTRDVEILSIFRRRAESFFPFPPGVRVTALDDQRAGATPARLRLLRAVLSSLPSVLVDPADRGAEECNLWADVMLVRRLRRQTGFLITTRPGLNMAAAYLSPPGLITIGEEQMHLHSHSRRLKSAMARSYPKLDALAVLTDGDLQEYEELLGADARRLRLVRIPNTVREIDDRRADLGAKTVLAAGRLTSQKGFDLLIQAYARVASVQPDWRLRICGRGDGRPDLERLIQELRLADVVELPGAKDLEEEMPKASLFVLSSRFEGFPLVLLEAMGKGMAVVSFDCPTGPGEVIDDHENGILVPALDVDGLAEGILELLRDEDLRRRCGAAAVETARRYTMAAVGPQWNRLLDELAQPRRAPADVAQTVQAGH